MFLSQQHIIILSLLPTAISSTTATLHSRAAWHATITRSTLHAVPSSIVVVAPAAAAVYAAAAAMPVAVVTGSTASMVVAAAQAELIVTLSLGTLRLGLALAAVTPTSPMILILIVMRTPRPVTPTRLRPLHIIANADVALASAFVVRGCQRNSRARPVRTTLCRTRRSVAAATLCRTRRSVAAASVTTLLLPCCICMHLQALLQHLRSLLHLRATHPLHLHLLHLRAAHPLHLLRLHLLHLRATHLHLLHLLHLCHLLHLLLRHTRGHVALSRSHLRQHLCLDLAPDFHLHHLFLKPSIFLQRSILLLQCFHFLHPFFLFPDRLRLHLLQLFHLRSTRQADGDSVAITWIS